MKFICLSNIYNNDIVNVFKSKASCAKFLGVSNQAIQNALKNKFKCKNFYVFELEVDNKKILQLCNDR